MGRLSDCESRPFYLRYLPEAVEPAVVAGCCWAVEGVRLPVPPQTNTPRMISAITTTAPIQMPLPKPRRAGGSKPGEVCEVSYRGIAGYFSARAVVTM